MLWVPMHANFWCTLFITFFLIASSYQPFYLWLGILHLDLWVCICLKIVSIPTAMQSSQAAMLRSLIYTIICLWFGDSSEFTHTTCFNFLLSQSFANIDSLLPLTTLIHLISGWEACILCVCEWVSEWGICVQC